jgi:hypothetical protein
LSRKRILRILLNGIATGCANILDFTNELSLLSGTMLENGHTGRQFGVGHTLSAVISFYKKRFLQETTTLA